MLRSPDCVVTSEFSERGGGRSRVFRRGPNEFWGVPGRFWCKIGRNTIKIVFPDPKIGGNVTLVQNFTLGMTPPQSGDVYNFRNTLQGGVLTPLWK